MAMPILWVSHLGSTSMNDTRGEKSPAAGKIWTHKLSVKKQVLYHCATTATGHVFFQETFPLS